MKNVCGVVLIEADTPEEADTKAETVGIYFDGCATNIDCACCGDRWARQGDFPDVYEVPNGVSIPSAILEEDEFGWGWTDAKAILHFKNGDKVTVHHKEQPVVIQ